MVLLCYWTIKKNALGLGSLVNSWIVRIYFLPVEPLFHIANWWKIEGSGNMRS